MFTLIKRELTDSIIPIIQAAVATGIILALIFFYNSTEQKPVEKAISLTAFLLFLNMLVLYVAASFQIRSDRNKKIFSFLSTLPTTRNQIFLAKIIAAVISILTIIIPVAVTALILIKKSVPAPVFSAYQPIILKVSAIIFLMYLAIYCFGLQNGWGQKKLSSVVSFFVLNFVIALSLIIKGFGYEILILLLLLVIALLTNIRFKFITTAL